MRAHLHCKYPHQMLQLFVIQEAMLFSKEIVYLCLLLSQFRHHRLSFHCYIEKSIYLYLLFYSTLYQLIVSKRT